MHHCIRIMLAPTCFADCHAAAGMSGHTSPRINTELARMGIHERVRTVREHRYTLPIVREIPRRAGRDALDNSIW